MSLSPRKIGSVVLMLVLVQLLTPAAYAVPPSSPQGAFHSGGFAAVWEWLVSLISPMEPELQSIQEKAGSSMDPNGMLQGSKFSPGVSDAGSQMDPDGYK